ncbi:aldehyde dehydrogenase family protein [Acanthopleuribacter pedis]|uniref:Aldehyde dehydrogenase n=1 Tax=Acanthopleuribacter pedis TaxID=442870 RepID=A0A8J7Q3U0_9BACT|nr:aldehyde dehydrogenase family protein [Acanthopleuribacter pedis]MBO1320062.1 aldehyde dehydrogenase [Acanthopleuribacter pedis]
MPGKIPHHPLTIAGEAYAGQSRYEVVNPADGRVIATVAMAGKQEVTLAVQNAAERFRGYLWRSMRPQDRANCLLRLAQRIREEAGELADLESRNAGKPIRAARAEIEGAARCFSYYAGAVDKHFGQTMMPGSRGRGAVYHEPIGVCGLIVPWNFPFLITAWKCAPALAMGNTVIVKPAEATPLTALRLAELAQEAGFPDGVLTVIPGHGDQAGEALVEHPSVRKISFTGSTETGKRVGRAAADQLKRVSLELGGKSANLVFADADLDECIDSSVWSVFDNSGQDCCSRSRMLVERPIYDAFLTRFAARTNQLVVGLPREETTDLGPLITPSHRARVCGFISTAQDQGAHLVQGGEIPAEAPLGDGNFLLPAILVNAHPSHKIMQEEVFGPVVCILPFSDEEEALSLANDTAYGLSGSLWTRDYDRVQRLVHGLEAGCLSVNSSSSVHQEMPFGGVKHSGYGRELGMDALAAYSQTKSVFYG